MNIDDINMIQKEAQGIFDLLQMLQLPVNENNVAILNGCMSSLKLIGKTLEEAKEGLTDEPEAE